MSDSDEQGFHQSSIEMFTIKTRHFQELKQNKIRGKNAYLYRSPLSLHHEQALYEYPKALDALIYANSRIAPPDLAEDPLQLIEKGEEAPILLSEFFPRKLNCVYNRFRENLILKRDTTILIRNIANRVRNDQLITFHDISQPTSSNLPLMFSSNFEGGNLHCVYRQKRSGCFYLLLQNDINTHGYNIWFHFKVKASQAGIYQFVIPNLAKEIKFSSEISLLTYSSLTNKYERVIGFRCTETKFKHTECDKLFWSIHFSYRFQTNENVYFSLCPPYTYSKLFRLLKQVSNPYHKNISISAEIAGKSQLGNFIPCLKMSSKEKASKNCIVFTARQHPCETVGSFVCEEIIKILAEASQLSHELLQTYTVFILPMLNPDGVIHGNSRTNLIGYDINRNWDVSSPTKTAETLQIWSYLLQLVQEEYRIQWSFDLHGHSKELGYFAYFCEENEQTLILNHYLEARDSCYNKQKRGFTLNRSKKQSIRGQLYTKLKVENAVTLETSYYGFRDKNCVLVQYTQEHFHQIALNLLQSLLSTQKTMSNQVLKQKVLQSIPKPSKIIQKYCMSRNVGEILSDSDPEEDYLRKQQRNQEEISTILGKKHFKVRAKTLYNNHNRDSFYEKLSKDRGKNVNQLIKDSQFSALKKSGFLEKQKNMSFYAGRRTFSPKSLRKCMQKQKLRKKIDIQPRLKSTHTEQLHQESFEYLKKSFSMRKRFKQQQDGSSKQKTYVGGFRTCYQVLGLKTVVYPTAASAGIEFQNHLKSKKQAIKQIRNQQLLPHPKPHRRKLSESYYN